MVLNLKSLHHGSDEYRAAIDLRDAILRKPLGLYYSPEELDAEADSFHLAVYLEDKLAGCLVLKPLNQAEIKMRQVAVDSNLQGQGIGRALVEYSEQFAKELGFQRTVLHARATAVPFYERLNYIKIGEEFTEVTIPHFQMYKDLS